MGLVVECANAKLMSKVDVATDVSEDSSPYTRPILEVAWNAFVMVSQTNARLPILALKFYSIMKAGKCPTSEAVY